MYSFSCFFIEVFPNILYFCMICATCITFLIGTGKTQTKIRNNG